MQGSGITSGEETQDPQVTSTKGSKVSSKPKDLGVRIPEAGGGANVPPLATRHGLYKMDAKMAAGNGGD